MTSLSGFPSIWGWAHKKTQPGTDHRWWWEARLQELRFGSGRILQNSCLENKMDQLVVCANPRYHLISQFSFTLQVHTTHVRRLFYRQTSQGMIVARHLTFVFLKKTVYQINWIDYVHYQITFVVVFLFFTIHYICLILFDYDENGDNEK